MKLTMRQEVDQNVLLTQMVGGAPTNSVYYNPNVLERPIVEPPRLISSTGANVNIAVGESMTISVTVFSPKARAEWTHNGVAVDAK